MRQIVLDTETTGLDAKDHRIIEIGCVELINRRITGEVYHVYINPDREIEKAASEVHGITQAFLQDKPRFKEIAKEFLAFVDNSEVIIHNAPFDVGFLNAELSRVSDSLGHFLQYCTVIDTLPMARQKHMGQRNSLDALCKRYGVDNTHREWHGALLDAELLAKVYLAMTGGQGSLFGELEENGMMNKEKSVISHLSTAQIPASLMITASREEQEAHRKKCEALGIPVW